MDHATTPGSGPAPTPPSLLRISVLGPLQIHYGPEDRTPSAPMARRVIAVLLLHANRLVSTSALIEELWDGEPPRLARKTVQTYVYQLRRALHCPLSVSERLETGPNGYRINLLAGELDLWDFDRKVTKARSVLNDGRSQEAAALLRSALDLWRGEPFAGLEASPILDARIAQLADSHLSAIELRIEADLQLGRHRGLIGELRQLTADHPLNEQFTAQLMLAAHRAGQRGTALDAFTRLRRHLVKDLGIEPSEKLQRLQQDVLSEAPRLTRPQPATPPPARPATAHPAPPPPPAPPGRRIAQLPPDTVDFVGRHDELAAVMTAAERTGHSQRTVPQVITVLGQAAAGKTTLAVRSAHLLTERFTDGQLYIRLHDGADEPLRPATVLRSLLRDIGMNPAGLPGEVEELARIFRSWSADRHLLLLLDDAAFTEQVLPLLPGGGSSLVLVTSRVRLPGLPGATTVELGTLATTDALELLAALIGTARTETDTGRARQVVRSVDSNPLAVRALGEKLAARPMWSLADLALRLTDENHRAAELRNASFGVLDRTAAAIGRLPAPLRQVLLRLAREGAAPIGITHTERVLQVDTWTAQTLVGDLLDHHIVELVDSPAGAGAAFRVPGLVRLAARTQQAPSGELHMLPGGLTTPARTGPGPASGPGLLIPVG